MPDIPEHAYISANIILLAKAPIPGFAKTRLIPSLGKQGAGLIAQKLLQQACQNALAVDDTNLHLALTPAPDHIVWQDYAHLIDLYGVNNRVNAYEQAEGDLGDRLIAACEAVANNYVPTVVMGTDCPDLTGSVIKDAIQQLNQYDAVMQPVHDGGYAMLVMKHFNREVFKNIRWSSAFTAADTLEKFKQLGWLWLELDPVSDIDEGDDLIHCPSEWLQDLPAIAD